MSRVARVAQVIWRFLPLTMFMLCASLRPAEGDARWLFAFKAGGAAACVHLLFFLCRERVVNRLILAVDLWLLLGGMAAFFHWEPALLLLRQTKETSLFAVICLVGAASTACGGAGFIGGPAGTRQTRIYSGILLGLVVLCGILSFLCNGRLFLSAVLPLVFCIVADSFLRKRAESIAASN